MRGFRVLRIETEASSPRLRSSRSIDPARGLPRRVNIRDYDGITWLFSQVGVGDKVVVYWS
jgi:hypothetical protein